jgi:hypothetical protein
MVANQWNLIFEFEYIADPLCTVLWQRLRLTINKIIHDDDIMVGCFQDSIARGNSDEEDARCIKRDAQERKAPALGRSGQYVLAEEQVSVNIEVFDHRAIVRIHVGEDSAEPFDRRRLCSARDKEECFRNVAPQGGKELLRAERVKQVGIDRVDISKSDRSVCWIDKVGTHLEPCSWSKEYGPARRVAVKEIRRHQARRRESVWNRVPVYLTAAMRKCAAYFVVGSEIAKIPKGVYRGLDIRWRRAGRFEHLGTSRSSYWIENKG